MARTSFYSSNQQKQRLYLTGRRDEEQNSDNQQMKLYQQIAEERGELDQASQFGRIANHVLSNVINTSSTDLFKTQAGRAVENNQLNRFMQILASVPKSQLNDDSATVQDIIKTKEFKSGVNRQLDVLIEKKDTKPKRVVSALVGEMEKSPLFNKIKQKLEASLDGLVAQADAQRKLSNASTVTIPEDD